MPHTLSRWLAPILLASLALVGCSRHIEPFVAGEQPHKPDLAKIFPEGAKMAPAGAPMMPPAPGAAPSASQRDTAPPIRGTVRLDPSLQSRVPPDAVLFIIARRAGGGGPPLAAKRISTPHFPLDFTLGPEDRMIKSMPFEGPLQLSVRVDGDGNAASHNPGDMDGAAAQSVEPGASGVEIVIDRVL
jgi:hypothetical protein